MSAGKIIDRITSDAQAKADEIIKAATDEANKVLAAAAADAQKMRDANKSAADKEAELATKRIIASGEMEAKKMLLKTKQDILQSAFDGAIKKVETMPNGEYEALLTKLMVKLIETGNEVVIMSAKEKARLSDSFIPAVNAAAQVKPCNVSLSGNDAKIGAGFILKRGDIEINATFEALIHASKEDLAPELVKILF